ncbi:MAG: hypothetical protein R3B70_07490 [Polyangiaceae bacterium]
MSIESTPNPIPTPSITAPSPASDTVAASAPVDMPLGLVAGAAGASSSPGISSAVFPGFAAMTTLVLNPFFPGAEASTTRVPGSTGTPVPSAAVEMAFPSMVIESPSGAVVFGASRNSRFESEGASAVMACSASPRILSFTLIRASPADCE